MKTFGQFIKESFDKKAKPIIKTTSDGYQTFQTVFGKHSGRNPLEASHPPAIVTDKDGYQSFETVFGKHSGRVPSHDNMKEEFEDPHNPGWKYGWGAEPKHRDKQISRGAAEANKPKLPHDYTPFKNSYTSHDTLYNNSLDDHTKKLEKHYPPPNDGNRYSALRDYTSDSSSVNSHLIHSHNNGVPHEYYKHTIDHLQDHLLDHKSSEDMHVYSGTRHSPEHYHTDETLGKKKMHLPAFTSTSISGKTASGFSSSDVSVKEPKYPGRHVLKIHVPAGSHGAYVDHCSSCAGEREFILPHGSKLHVDHEPTTHHFDDPYSGSGKDTVHVWNATLQPHGHK